MCKGKIKFQLAVITFKIKICWSVEMDQLTSYSCRGPGFSSQYIYDGSPPSLTPVPGNLMPSADNPGHQHACDHIHTYWQIVIHIKINLKKISSWCSSTYLNPALSQEDSEFKASLTYTIIHCLKKTLSYL